LDVTISGADDPPVQALSARIQSTLANIYGEGSAEYDRLRGASDLDDTHDMMSPFGDGRTPPDEIRLGIDRGRNRALATLEGEVHALS